MSEREPDPAALDELSRAFGDVEGVRIIPREPNDPAADDDLEPTAPTPLVERPGAGRDEPHPPANPDAPADPAPADRVSEPAPLQVISIGGDDLPDTVYVEGALDAGMKRRGGSGVVVIEDDETGDALKPESERDLRRGIEPRMRDRRIAVKRAKAKRRLVWVGLGAGVLLVVVAALAVLGSGLFSIQEDSVTVTGAVYTDPDQLQAVIDELVGTPTLLADTGEAERRLEQIPWVESAEVSASFPHSARIDIRERQALTTYQGPDQRFRVLDREGRVLDVLDKWPLAYVLLVGPDPVDLAPGETAPTGYAAASELAKNLTPGVRSVVDRIEVTADGSDLVLWLDDGTDVHFGQARDLLDKLVRLETVLADIALEQADPEATQTGPPYTIDISTRETTR